MTQERINLSQDWWLLATVPCRNLFNSGLFGIPKILILGAVGCGPLIGVPSTGDAGGDPHGDGGAPGGDGGDGDDCSVV